VTTPLVELERVEVRLGDRQALADISFSLREGESWAVLGPNGSGKSTLLKVLRGEIWPHPTQGSRRLFHLNGRAEESPLGVRALIGLVSPERQERYARRGLALTAEAVVRSGFGDDIFPAQPATQAQSDHIARLLAEFGIPHLAARSILELSSGEARQVLFARALVARPRLLFLDEPCHGLDRHSRTALLGLASKVARQGTPIVLATHRHDELIPEITKVAVLDNGRILAQGERGEVLSRQASTHVCPTRTPPPQRPRGGKDRILFSAESAEVRIDGRPVLRELSFSVRAGENWAVVGPNGAGKSTLLRLLVGDEQCMPGGRVLRFHLGERANVFEVKARVGIVSSELQARHRADLLAEDVVASGFTSSIGLVAPPSPPERAAAARCMARLDVLHLAGRTVHSISYGEFRRLLLARALVRDPELLVLDEPCDGLDPASRRDLLLSLQRLCEAGTQLVMVTHHLEDLVPAIDRVLELREGRAIYRGPRSGWSPASTP